MGNGYLEFDTKIRKTDYSNFSITAPGHDGVRLIIDAFDYLIHDARITTSYGNEIEQNKFVGPIPIIIRLVTQKDDDLSTFLI